MSWLPGFLQNACQPETRISAVPMLPSSKHPPAPSVLSLNIPFIRFHLDPVRGGPYFHRSCRAFLAWH